MKTYSLNRLNIKRIFIGVMAAVCMIFTSCTQEKQEDDVLVSADSGISLRFNMLSAEGETDVKVNRVRVVIFGSDRYPSADRGKLIYNKMVTPKDDGQIASIVIPVGFRDIYIIANEPLSEEGAVLAEYKNIATATDIERLEISYTGALSAYGSDNIPMFEKHLNFEVVKNAEENVIQSNIERTIAKVTLNLKIKNSNFVADKQPIIKDITIKNLPNKSFYISKPYTDNMFVASQAQLPLETSIGGGYDYSSSNTFYVPEYILSELDKNAFIEITGAVNGDLTRELKWIVKLGDAMVDGKTLGDRYDITRNRHYNIDADVKSYGSHDIDVAATVTPWNTVNNNPELPGTVVFSGLTHEDGREIYKFIDESLYVIEADGETLNITCNTNVGRWYAVVPDPSSGGFTRSNMTSAVESPTLQTVALEVYKIYDETYTEFEIKIYHDILAPEKDGDPITSFRVVLYSGIIPSSVLERSGWPKSALPKVGLMVAKRGNVLPWETAKSSDPTTIWSTDNSATNTDISLGSGKSNSDKLFALSPTKYPFTDKCAALGKDWYLPSMKEWMLIFNYIGYFRKETTFKPMEFYHSSSEFSDRESWYVYVNNVYTPLERNAYKTMNYYIRCVKNL